MDSCEMQRKLCALLRESGEAKRYNETGIWLYRLKDFENAMKFMEKAHTLCPGDTDIMYNYASALYMMARWENCAEAFESLLLLEPENKQAREKLMHARYCLGQYMAGEACLNKAQKTE